MQLANPTVRKTCNRDQNHPEKYRVRKPKLEMLPLKLFVRTVQGSESCTHFPLCGTSEEGWALNLQLTEAKSHGAGWRTVLKAPRRVVP
jgi:hypothetical protein